MRARGRRCRGKRPIQDCYRLNRQGGFYRESSKDRLNRRWRGRACRKRTWACWRAGHSRRVDRNHSDGRSEEHTSELQSLMRISYAVFCLKKKKQSKKKTKNVKNSIS